MNNQNKKGKFTFLDIVIVVLSIYVLVALLFDSILKLDPEITKLLLIIDNIICIIFLFEFFHRLSKAESKKEFLKWGWIDFVSSIPTFEVLRYGRLIRLFRLLRILRAFRSVKYITQHLFSNRTEGTFATVSFVAFLMVLFGSIAILQVEVYPTSNIRTAEDAVWWAFTTTSTVGYADKFPITTEGKIISAFLMITGVGFFGTFTGFIASWFIGGDKKK